ncbi:MAG: iron-containing alcohol dehydrogenase [Deltaproteobacteria bacterium]|jgi:alcohol dehydrogenase YqhD (iron-dependent ADH family)|nr:iron-containing alcohol dehydrogenase [Deltaproteobacteria bacterium]
MYNFTFYSPTRIIFGKDSVPKIIPELKTAKISSVLLLTGGKSIYASGLYATVTGLLQSAGISFETVSGVQTNPRLSKVREAIRVVKAKKLQAILPVGGGSVFDSAKAIAAGSVSEHDIWDIYTGKYPVEGALPIYGILTLSGTSSESNNTGVLNNEETRDKFPIANDLLIPKVAIVDPLLQYSVPLAQVRSSGLDALTHILEAYFEGVDSTSEVIVEHCETYARRIIRSLNALPAGLHDYDVRAQLAFCSVYAHSGWASVGRNRRGDFSSHRIGHSLGGLFDVPHGVTLGIIMPNWMQHAYDKGLAHPAFARFATNILGITEAPGKDFALAGVKAFKDFVRSLEMPTTLTEVGVKEADIPALTEHALKTLPFGCVMPMDAPTISAIFKRAL